jgi:hypothetical protein
VAYLEVQLPDLMPTTLLKEADNKTQVLKHAGQWKDNKTPAVMALQAAFDKQRQESAQTIKQLVAHIGQLHRRAPPNPSYGTASPTNDYNINKHGKRPQSDGQLYTHPIWMITAPKNHNEVQVIDRRAYTWCSKCHWGEGLWMSNHTTATHVDNYCSQRRRPDTQHKRVNLGITQHSAHDAPTSSDATALPSASLPLHPLRQLSLLDYLESYIPPTPEDVPTTNLQAAFDFSQADL